MAHSCYCILILSLLILIITSAHETHQKNYTLYRLVALTKRDRQILYIIHKNYDHCHFLNGISNEAAIPMHIAVEDGYLEHFEQLINNTDSLYSKYQNFTYAPELQEDKWDSKTVVDDDILFDKFHSFSTILKMYQFWETKYPKIFRQFVIGKTQENRDIIVLKVSGTKRERENPAIFMLGGEEGRDWISPAVILVYIKNLIKGNFDSWATTKFDVYFLPVMNPDGYFYSMSKDRFWAKNRKIIQPRTICHPPVLARGVNIDRNWLYKNRGEKACNRIYLEQYLSEYETHNLSAFLDSIAPKTLAFFNVKGFDNLITTPFATNDKTQKNIDIVREILRHTCQDLDSNFNKSYYYGVTKNLLFNYTGNCADWVKHQLNVPVVATFYVKHEDNVLPETYDIVPLSSQFSVGINKILSITTDLYGPLFNSQWQHVHNILIQTNLCCILLCVFLL